MSRLRSLVAEARRYGFGERNDDNEDQAYEMAWPDHVLQKLKPFLAGIGLRPALAMRGKMRLEGGRVVTLEVEGKTSKTIPEVLSFLLRTGFRWEGNDKKDVQTTLAGMRDDPEQENVSDWFEIQGPLKFDIEVGHDTIPVWFTWDYSRTWEPSRTGELLSVEFARVA